MINTTSSQNTPTLHIQIRQQESTSLGGTSGPVVEEQRMYRAHSVCTMDANILGPNSQNLMRRTMQVATLRGFEALSRSEGHDLAPLSTRNSIVLNPNEIHESEIVYVHISTFLKQWGLERKNFKATDLSVNASETHIEAGLRIRQTLNKVVERRVFFLTQYKELQQRIAQPIDTQVVERAKKLLAQAPPLSDLSSLPRANSPEFIQARIQGSNTIQQGSSDRDAHNKKCDYWLEAEYYVRKLVEKREPLTAQNLCKIQGMIEQDNPDRSLVGVIRDGIEKTGDLYYPFTSQKDIEAELNHILEGLEEHIRACEKQDPSAPNPIVLAAQTYQKLVSLHPFGDGNGRTCRLAMDYVLMRLRLPPAAMGKNVAFAMFGPQINPKLNPKVAEINVEQAPTNAVKAVIEGIENSYRLLGNPL